MQYLRLVGVMMTLRERAKTATVALHQVLRLDPGSDGNRTAAVLKIHRQWHVSRRPQKRNVARESPLALAVETKQ
jgi:hypothetical protein